MKPSLLPLESLEIPPSMARMAILIFRVQNPHDKLSMERLLGEKI